MHWFNVNHDVKKRYGANASRGMPVYSTSSYRWYSLKDPGVDNSVLNYREILSINTVETLRLWNNKCKYEKWDFFLQYFRNSDNSARCSQLICPWCHKRADVYLRITLIQRTSEISLNVYKTIRFCLVNWHRCMLIVKFFLSLLVVFIYL